MIFTISLLSGRFMTGKSSLRVQRLTSSLLLSTTLLLATGFDPGWAQTSLDAGISGDQTLPSAPPLPDNRPVIFVDAANGSDTRGDGSRNNPFKTITHAVQRAPADSTIQLFPGVYSEQSGEIFPIRLKAGLTLRGDESTLGEGYLITGGGTYISPTVARQNVTMLAETGAEVRGISMRNEGRRGYALWIESASPRIFNSSFVNSIHDGIFITGASNPWIEGNRFYRNGANGISVLGTSQPTIVNNLFQETGFGLTLDQRSKAIVRNNRILQNRTGVIVGGSSQPVLRNNLVANNLEAGLIAITNALPDLGTAADPGNNIFEGNGQYDINNSTRGLRINANGNRLQGKTKGDLDLAGQTTVAVAPTAAPNPISPGALSLPSTPTLPAASESAPAATPTAATPTLPTLTVPETTSPTAISPTDGAQGSLDTGSGGRIVPSTSGSGTGSATAAPAVASETASETLTQPQAQEFTAVPFTPDGSTTPAQPVVPLPAASNSSSPPLRDITTLLPPPAQRQSQAAAAPSAAPVSAAPPAQAVAAADSATQFRVLVTPKSSEDLSRLQQLIPGAVETVFNGRNVLQAGLYDNRSQAQSVLDQLLDAGFDAVAEMIFR
ncbi:MAG: DUF1565 domain-containing protein [Cyanobacteriota bacterium]